MWRTCGFSQKYIIYLYDPHTDRANRQWKENGCISRGSFKLLGRSKLGNVRVLETQVRATGLAYHCRVSWVCFFLSFMICVMLFFWESCGSAALVLLSWASTSSSSEEKLPLLKCISEGEFKERQRTRKHAISPVASTSTCFTLDGVPEPGRRNGAKPSELTAFSSTFFLVKWDGPSPNRVPYFYVYSEWFIVTVERPWDASASQPGRAEHSPDLTPTCSLGSPPFSPLPGASAAAPARYALSSG